MFTGFASENTPAIQVWDFSRSSSGIQLVSLPNDCAPIQVFQTGGSSLPVRIYLPTCPIEGKQITIINAKYSLANNQSMSVFSSDVMGDGDINPICSVGISQTLTLCYSKNFISLANSAVFGSGWIFLNTAPVSSPNAYAINSGGNSNNATSQFSSAIGGQGNFVNNTYAAILGGQQNTAGGTHSSIVGGASNSAQGSYAFAGAGQGNAAGGNHSSVVGGQAGSARSINGNFVTPASSAPITVFQGRQQLATLLLGRATSNATATVLASDSNAASTSNQVILPNNSAYTFQGTCIAARTAAGDTSSWKFEGAIKRGANAASTVLVAAVTPTVIAQDVGASTWVLAITADTTNGGIAVTVTGQASTTIRWVVKIETTEVTF